jgi:uroporphyrinogen-III synthase
MAIAFRVKRQRDQKHRFGGGQARRGAGSMPPMSPVSLAGRTIAIPEARALEIFAGLLERRGARVIRCPMLAIHDAPDPAPVLDWCRALAGGQFDAVILLTGEGLRRLLGTLERYEPALRPAFLAALARAYKITRGPKPAQVLRECGLTADLAAPEATTRGVVDALSSRALGGWRMGVQLYGTEPNLALTEFLRSAGALVWPVAPYVYADAADEQAVRALLEQVRAGQIDAIAFTSTAQLERLVSIAGEEQVRGALRHTLVAAVGPVTASALRRRGIEPQLTPAASYFLKPLTAALLRALGTAPP